jgi:hypothetical protein
MVVLGCVGGVLGLEKAATEWQRHGEKREKENDMFYSSNHLGFLGKSPPKRGLFFIEPGAAKRHEKFLCQ